MIERIDEKYEGRFKPRALAAERATRAKLEAKGSKAGQDRPMRKEANPQESEAQAEPAKQEAKRIRYNDRAGSNTRRRSVGRPHRKSEQGGQWEPPRSQTWKHEQGRMVRIRRGRDEAIGLGNGHQCPKQGEGCPSIRGMASPETEGRGALAKQFRAPTTKRADDKDERMAWRFQE